MSTRVDQRGKNQQQPQQQSHQVNGGVRVEDYDYAHPQMHGQPHPQQAQYNAATLQMPSPTAADTYLPNYYPQALSYPTGFYDGTTWASSNTDLSYPGTYGQPMGMDYMQQFGLECNIAGFWNNGYGMDYSTFQPSSGQQQDPMKVVDGQAYMPSMDQAYAGAYHSPAGSHQNPVTNGQESSAIEADEMTDLEQGMQTVSVNGTSEEGQDSPSETSLQEANAGNVNNSSVTTASTNSSQAKSMSWANVAKTPAKPAPVVPKILTRPQPVKPNQESSWEKSAPKPGSQGQRGPTWSAPRSNRNGTVSSNAPSNPRADGSGDGVVVDPTLSKLKQSNAYNPKSFDMNPKNARFFVIKSYSEDDIHRAIKYDVWCSTEHGNKRLDDAFKDREGKGPIYLFYSVNGSGHFCGMAQMMSGVDYQTHAGVWTQDKWKGKMEIKWIYVKDVPNSVLRHIRLENNENKPVTNSRDTQEVPYEKGKQVLKHMHNYKHTTSIFDDFGHYEKKEVEEGGDASEKKKSSPKTASGRN